jgi:polysaccharide deacetylase family protein (PEP-CTERM system associated)
VTTSVTPNSIVNALSVDVEDYFQVSAMASVVVRDQWDSYERRVADNTNRLLQVLSDHAVRATFFTLGWIAEREPALIRRIVAEGHEIASHGYDHRLVYDQTPEEFRRDVRRAKGILESVGGTGVFGYRAPSYSVTGRSLWALEVLAEEGYLYDASIFPIRHDRYGIPNAPRHPHLVGSEARPLLEIPASTARLCGMNLPIGGGGYFRLLPYWWTRWGIARVNKVERRPAVFYLHPWEIDADQPRLKAPWVSAFRHYTNLRLTEGRLHRLLVDFRFDTIDRTFVHPVVVAAGRY